MVTDEGGFPLISFLDPNVVVPPPKVYLGEVLEPLELVDKLGDEGKEVVVSNCVVVQVVIVLHHPFMTILLQHKEYGTSLL